MSVYYGGLHTPVPLVVTSHEGSPLSPVHVHGHARLSCVNSSSFSTLQLSYSSFSSYLPFSSRIRALVMKTYRATPYVRSHHPGVKTGARHPLVWKSNRESGGNSRLLLQILPGVERRRRFTKITRAKLLASTKETTVNVRYVRQEFFIFYKICNSLIKFLLQYIIFVIYRWILYYMDSYFEFQVFDEWRVLKIILYILLWSFRILKSVTKENIWPKTVIRINDNISIVYTIQWPNEPIITTGVAEGMIFGCMIWRKLCFCREHAKATVFVRWIQPQSCYDQWHTKV